MNYNSMPCTCNPDIAETGKGVIFLHQVGCGYKRFGGTEPVEGPGHLVWNEGDAFYSFPERPKFFSRLIDDWRYFGFPINVDPFERPNDKE